VEGALSPGIMELSDIKSSHRERGGGRLRRLCRWRGL
jgi:hypothetical protein